MIIAQCQGVVVKFGPWTGNIAARLIELTQQDCFDTIENAQYQREKAAKSSRKLQSFNSMEFPLARTSVMTDTNLLENSLNREKYHV
jgi:hypothetical protein